MRWGEGGDSAPSPPETVAFVERLQGGTNEVLQFDEKNRKVVFTQLDSCRNSLQIDKHCQHNFEKMRAWALLVLEKVLTRFCAPNSHETSKLSAKQGQPRGPLLWSGLCTEPPPPRCFARATVEDQAGGPCSKRAKPMKKWVESSAS